MPIYYYWGDDEFAIASSVQILRAQTVDFNWASFNYTQYTSDTPDAATEALNQAMTPPFGSGSRLVWLVNTTIGQQCPDDLLVQLKRTLPVIPETSVLLLTSRNKPDGRLKSTALWKEYAEIKEFALIPPWETKQLVQQVEKIAQEVGVKLTSSSTTLIAQSVGNNTRQLYNELTKLRLYASDQTPISVDIVNNLVQATSQTSLDLVKVIAEGNTAQALTLVGQLLNRNEPGLKIVATLVGQFRTWLWVKIMTEAQERDKKIIAQAAEIGNPNRVYFLQQEVKSLSVEQLVATLPLLLELEVSLKQGGEERAMLQTKVIQLSQLFL